MRVALLLEAAPDGTVRKLELAAPAGLLTLHPEGGALHGNVVRPDGIDHVALPWADGTVVVVEGSPVAAAAAVRALDGRVPDGGVTLPGVVIDASLGPRIEDVHAERVGERRWRLGRGRTAITVTLDADGIPALDDAVGWPLEVGG